MSNMFEIYNDIIDELIAAIKAGVTELSNASTPFVEPRIVKHDLAERAVVNDFFAIVSAGQMEIQDFSTNTVTDHIFSIPIDLTFYSDDFEFGQEEILRVSGKIYDLIHLKNVVTRSRLTWVEFFPVPPGQIENLYAITNRIIVKCEIPVQA